MSFERIARGWLFFRRFYQKAGIWKAPSSAKQLQSTRRLQIPRTRSYDLVHRPPCHCLHRLTERRKQKMAFSSVDIDHCSGILAIKRLCRSTQTLPAPTFAVLFGQSPRSQPRLPALGERSSLRADSQAIRYLREMRPKTASDANSCTKISKVNQTPRTMKERVRSERDMGTGSDESDSPNGPRFR